MRRERALFCSNHPRLTLRELAVQDAQVRLVLQAE
jgi:hypothetical protein